MRQTCGASVAFVISAGRFSDVVWPSVQRRPLPKALSLQEPTRMFFYSHPFIKPHFTSSTPTQNLLSSKVSRLPYSQSKVHSPHQHASCGPNPAFSVQLLPSACHPLFKQPWLSEIAADSVFLLGDGPRPLRFPRTLALFG